MLEVANRPGYASLTPHQIVPKLADEGRVYLASESTFYRILKAAGQGQRRGRAQAATTTHAHDALRHRPEPGVVLGYHVDAQHGAGGATSTGT